jgi:hypothetical protein
MVSRSTYKNTFKTLEITMWAFIKSNYSDIEKEVYKKTQEYNIPEKELLVEIDFYGDAPALRNEFKVWLTSGFSEGSSIADAPDWFHTYNEKKNVARHVKEEYKKVTNEDLLVICRAGNGIVSITSTSLGSLDGMLCVHPLHYCGHVR